MLFWGEGQCASIMCYGCGLCTAASQLLGGKGLGGGPDGTREAFIQPTWFIFSQPVENVVIMLKRLLQPSNMRAAFKTCRRALAAEDGNRGQRGQTETLHSVLQLQESLHWAAVPAMLFKAVID